MEDLIVADNISVIRENKRILDNVSVSLKESEFITVVGPNGAGKTMLLKALIGLEKIDSGNISKKVDLKVGYVPQRIVPSPVMPLSVERFLRLGNNVNADEISDIAAQTGISDIMQSGIYDLSGGELQRVLIARALLGQPELLILDEPVQNIDVKGQVMIYKILEDIYKSKNISIIMVSHDLHMVMASTSRVICLYHHICCSGEPRNIARDPAFTEIFGHDISNMMAAYPHIHDHTHNDG